MSKPAKSGYATRKAFVDTKELRVQVLEADGRITGFDITYKNKQQVIHVTGNDITAAWKKLEKLTEKL